MDEIAVQDPEGTLVLPTSAAPLAAILVLDGSSGRVNVGRARLLARLGYAALAIRWFGGEGQPKTPREVALEAFTPALDRLSNHSDHLAVLGTSFGAEAALLLGTIDTRIDTTAALAPTSVVWATPDHDEQERPIAASKWTQAGRELPFVEYIDQTTPHRSVLDNALAVHQASLEHNQAQIAAATIPVENIRGRVLVAAGGADRVWPSTLFAHQIADRRAKAGLETTMVLHAQAGHRAVLPGEEPAPLRADLPRGGTPSADAEHGAQILQELLTLMPTNRP